jgi:hypothetical protein
MPVEDVVDAVSSIQTRVIDEVCRVEQAAGGGLLDELVGDIVEDLFEASEKPVNCLSCLCWSPRVVGRVL